MKPSQNPQFAPLFICQVLQVSLCSFHHSDHERAIAAFFIDSESRYQSSNQSKISREGCLLTGKCHPTCCSLTAVTVLELEKHWQWTPARSPVRLWAPASTLTTTTPSRNSDWSARCFNDTLALTPGQTGSPVARVSPAFFFFCCPWKLVQTGCSSSSHLPRSLPPLCPWRATPAPRGHRGISH